MTLNKALPCSYLVAHQHIENLISLDCFLDVYPENRPLFGIHCRIPESLGVHFSQTLIPAHFWLFAVVLGFVLLDKGIALFFGLDVKYLFPLADVEERWLRYIEVPSGNERLHVAEEEGQQQGANVSAVNVGVAHDDNAPVAQF